MDAVGAVFPFGSEPFVRLRESFWLQTFIEAARSGQSLIFTFAPEATVDADFPTRVRAAIAPFGGAVVFIALTVSHDVNRRAKLTPDRRPRLTPLAPSVAVARRRSAEPLAERSA
ncbi:hypothetical protein ACO2Q0_21585 [Phenylobacterium sp. VNQ135]|uniref:hypothetical protein n=1 Tax=Phenylobacterium sp. VNQ135 TaxID=3400922 RepID=UPI003BFC3744